MSSFRGNVNMKLTASIQSDAEKLRTERFDGERVSGECVRHLNTEKSALSRITENVKFDIFLLLLQHRQTNWLCCRPGTNRRRCDLNFIYERPTVMITFIAATRYLWVQPCVTILGRGWPSQNDRKRELMSTLSIRQNMNFPRNFHCGCNVFTSLSPKHWPGIKSN